MVLVSSLTYCNVQWSSVYSSSARDLVLLPLTLIYILLSSILQVFFISLYFQDDLIYVFCHHSKGSVVVDFILQLDSVTTASVLQRILVNSVNANGGQLGDKSVAAGSISFTGQWPHVIYQLETECSLCFYE